MSKNFLPISIHTSIKTGWLYFVRQGKALLFAAGMLLAGLAGKGQSCAPYNDIGINGDATSNTITICRAVSPSPSIILNHVGAVPPGAPSLTAAYFWVVSTDGGLNYTSISGATSRFFTVNGTYKNVAGVYMFKRFVSKSASCDGYSDIITVTVVANTASAGGVLNRICVGDSTELLGGTVGGAATSGVWTASPDTGTFKNNSGANPANAYWVSPPGYKGSPTFTLTATNGSCANATATKKVAVVDGLVLQFTTQPAAGATVLQDAATTVEVQVYNCSPSPGAVNVAYSGNMELSAYTGCGFVKRTVAVSGGTATFSGADAAIFTRSTQKNVQLMAKIGGDSVFSNIFNVGAPGPIPVTETLWFQNYEGAGTWTDSVGDASYTGSGIEGTDWTVIKTLHGNKTRAKSYTTENDVDERLSTNTINFPTKYTSSAGLPLTDYKNLVLRFKVGSIYDPAGTPRSPGALVVPPAIPKPSLSDPSGGQEGGSGVDKGENMYMKIQIDGVWYDLLSYLIGTLNYTFGFSTVSDIITYNGASPYTNPQDVSQFIIRIPEGTSSVGLQMTAKNNRPSENWCIDDVSLTGVKNTPGSPKTLPFASGVTRLTCPNSIVLASASITDAYPPLSYSWSPSTYITSGAATATPTFLFTPASPTVYSITAKITDVDGCYDTAKVEFRYPVGTAGTWFGYQSQDWFDCKNWGGGVVPSATQDVNIPTSGTDKFPEINPSSIYASSFANIAYAKNITIGDSLYMYAGAVLKVKGNLAINYTDGTEFGSIDMTAGNTNTDPNTLYVSGNWTNNTGTITRQGFVPSKSKIVFDSTVATQTLITKDTLATFYDLEINKPNGVLTIKDSVLVTNSLTHASGVINTVVSNYSTHLPSNTNGLLVMDTAAIVAGSPSASSYVNGKMAKRTNRNNASEFTFPIGKAGSSLPSVYQPAGILPVAHAAGTTVTSYTAEFYNRPPGNDINPDVVADPILTALLSNQYWIMTKTADAAKARVVMHYTATPAYTDWRLVPGYGALTPPIPSGTNVAVAHHDGLKWAFTKGANNFNVSGPIYEAIYYTTTGKVYTDTMSSFSPFTIGFGDNTLLPVKLLSFEGRLLGADGSLSWRVADSKDLASFDLEYSTNGQQYKKLVNMPASASNAYGYLHRMLSPGTHYYRLLVKEKNGNAYYSPIVILTVGKLRTQIVGLTNTLVKNRVGINILSANSQGVQAQLTDVLGRQLTTQRGALQAGINQWQLPTSLLAKGMYFISIITDDGIKETLQFVKE